jgi:GNAT superfamily N-acetyltransferase
VFVAGSYRCTELARDQVPDLQRFFERNAEYFHAVTGRAPHAGQALEEYESEVPADWPFEKKWILRFDDADREMAAMADVVSNLFAEGVWHIGLFIVATRLHGSGAATMLYQALESWMRARGAKWLRLGVVVGNGRAERFWERLGYIEVRKRFDIEIEGRLADLRVMVKPLTAEPLSTYLALVARDRED